MRNIWELVPLILEILWCFPYVLPSHVIIIHKVSFIIIHKVVLLLEDEPAKNKETNGSMTSQPLFNS